MQKEKEKKKCHDGANKRFSSQTRIYEQGNSRFWAFLTITKPPLVILKKKKYNGYGVIHGI